MLETLQKLPARDRRKIGESAAFRGESSIYLENQLRTKIAKPSSGVSMTRVYLPDVSVHVIRRGNNRAAIFGDDTDRELFLGLLEVTAAKRGVDVHGYTMMSTHYHLVVTPKSEDALPYMMRDLGREYVLRFNRKYGRIGTLWAGRYRPIVIADEPYLLTCLRYIEQNPVRAGMVSTPSEYRWSSFGFLGLGQPSEWLVPHPVYIALGSTAEERQCAYRALCDEPLPDSDLVRQRDALLVSLSRPDRHRIATLPNRDLIAT
jgi:REP-associated tyrosine transposase